MKRILIALIFVLAMTGCRQKPDGKDADGYFYYRERCVESHTEEETGAYVDANGNLMPYTSSIYVCDRYVTDKVHFDYKP